MHVIGNIRGSSLIMPMVMSAVSLIIFGSIGIISLSNQITHAKLNRRAAKKYLLRELKTILAAPGVCLNSLRVNHNNNSYNFNGLLNNGQAIRAINGSSISNLYLTNRVNIVGNIWEADFNVDIASGNIFSNFFDQYDITTRVRYTLQANGTVSECGLVVNSEDACGQLGLVWDLVSQSCDICASMGGNTVNGVCQL